MNTDKLKHSIKLPVVCRTPDGKFLSNKTDWTAINDESEYPIATSVPILDASGVTVAIVVHESFDAKDDSVSKMADFIVLACNNFAASQKPQWQPIESAPKDGTTIDIWTKSGDRMCEVHWNLIYGCWFQKDRQRLVDMRLPKYWMPRPANPIEWLPEPPTE